MKFPLSNIHSRPVLDFTHVDNSGTRWQLHDLLYQCWVCSSFWFPSRWMNQGKSPLTRNSPPPPPPSAALSTLHSSREVMSSLQPTIQLCLRIKSVLRMFSSWQQDLRYWIKLTSQRLKYKSLPHISIFPSPAQWQKTASSPRSETLVSTKNFYAGYLSSTQPFSVASTTTHR